MTHRQSGIDHAIQRSISHDEIVTATVSDIDAAYIELISQRECAQHDSCDTRDADDQSMREVWGTTETGDTWRVHLVIAE